MLKREHIKDIIFVSPVGSSVIDAWPLTRAVQDTMQVPQTHDRPIAKVTNQQPACLYALSIVLLCVKCNRKHFGANRNIYCCNYVKHKKI